MKQHLRFLFTLLLAIVCGGAMFGQTTKSVTCTLGKDAKSCTSTGDCSVSWTYSADPTTTNQTQNGMYWAVKSGKVTLTATLSDKNATITSVVITGYTNKGTGKTIDVTVGGKAFGETISLETTSNDYTLSGSVAGDLALILKSTTTTKSHIIKTVKINYTGSSSTTEQGTTLSFPSTSVTANVGETITIPAATLKAGETELTDKTITYSCEGDKTGVVESFDPTTRKLTLGSVAGTATVSANFAGDATYAASTASYTITVAEKGKTATTLSFGADYDGKTIEKHVGEEINQVATLTPAVAGVTITYKSSAPEVAEVDGGYVAIYKAGDAVITASYAGDDTYAASEVSYTIHATKVPVTLSLAQTEEFHINYGADEGIKMIENKATLTPAEAGSVKYEISYNSVAGITTIDDKGTVMVDTKKIGNSTIKVSFVNKDANTYADVAPVTYKIYVDDNRTTPTLTFDKESYTFDLGATVAPFTNQLTAPEGVTVVYSSNSDIATVNGTTGEVTLNTAAVGKATITATFAGNDSYKPATATYMLEVVDPNNMEATFDFEKPEDYGYDKPAKSDKTDLNDGDKLVSGKVTLTNVKGATTTTRFKDDKGDLTFRVYTGAVLTVSAPKGYVITKMIFTDNGSQPVSNLNFDPGKLNNKTWTGSAQEVKMTVRANQVFLKKLVVTYSKLETLTTAASGFATYAADYDVNYSALGLATYTIALDEVNNKVSYNRFEGVVPAGKAVLVQGTASTPYALTPAEGAADETFTTDLKASDGTVTAADDKIYAFGTLNGKSGFKLVNNGIKIPAKKGYLQLTGTTAAKPTFFAFDGIGTGISHIEADAALENAAMYNLAGQRVDKSYKGVVIVNGKKMLRK